MPLQGASYNNGLLVKKDMKARFPSDGIHIAKIVICTIWLKKTFFPWK